MTGRRTGATSGAGRGWTPGTGSEMPIGRTVLPARTTVLAIDRTVPIDPTSPASR